MNDGGLMWWAQLGKKDVQEFMEWMDGMDERGNDVEKQVEKAEFERDYEREERLIRSVENE